ncbi:nucleotidyltransferase family protein [uncultured Campylobacter sp.]|uniref:D-glycero-D-manno-heptose 1-phosphate guanosyltransferase n=1 Tax=uncultured Campylobacter sp. TaxID=218934 RepID=UPI00262662B6|nr:nucleotidyltransferase family protein [uncultured Campylobacter sp.]
MDSSNKAIVLCGGLGTRLRAVIKDVPKPMAPIGNKPFLSFVLEYLQKQDIKEVVLAVSYKYEVIQEYFKDSFLNMDIKYSIEKNPLGTGGAIKQALSLMNSDCFVLNGDTFFDINLKNMTLDNSKICIALKKMLDFDRYGCINFNDNFLITSFEEKKFHKEGFINGGIYLVSKDIFKDFKLEDNFSFEDFLQANFKLLNAKAKPFDDYFIDIGIPKDYNNFKEYVTQL